MIRPAPERGRDEGARIGRRVEVADEARIVEAMRGKRGEERRRHSEDHRVGVDEHEGEDDAAAECVLEG